MTILVTGCAGFIGWRTSSMLIEQGHKVIGIDNFNSYYDTRLKDWRTEQLKKSDSFELVNGDIENLGLLNYLFSNHRFDAVINLAARAGVRYSMENPHVYLNSNADGTLNLLECMRKNNIKKLVLASTSSLYAGQEMPFLESLPVNQPISPYAASKKAAEVMAYTYHYLYGFDVSVVRYFTVYGPAGRPDMSPLRFIKWIDEGTPIKLFGDGTQSRDFTYVDDIARGTILALAEVGYEIINLGGGNNPISILKMINTFEKLLGKKATIDERPFNKSDMKHTWANIEKAKELLNWSPEIDFDTGMQRTVDWYLENKEWVCDLRI
ncbi:GDP-mannose 4,6-dehydratase [Pelagicoccus sp. SDUM812003]|uniref:GDP-mannose 4,6-dehydratase n=1 Tax=Pelagicoccus sp. SDUM812003 TaxID=3041267 RepID=UPI00280C4739|nr:GDP-mannose 4,6-dehydratase [Pelagicoccus sp. SDUM812003]MDQ8205633.1 GDP-mannose 4,6-dehydratase [Pelagicoccus sp. SDUM812003]